MKNEPTGSVGGMKSLCSYSKDGERVGVCFQGPKKLHDLVGTALLEAGYGAEPVFTNDSSDDEGLNYIWTTMPIFRLIPFLEQFFDLVEEMTFGDDTSSPGHDCPKGWTFSQLSGGNTCLS